MKKNRFICGLTAAMLVLHGCLAAFAASEPGKGGELVFLEDYQELSAGSKPPYGGGGWDSDNLAAGDPAFRLEVVRKGENQSLLLSCEGTESSASGDVLISKKLSMQPGEIHTFYTKLRTDDSNSYKRLFIRGQSSNAGQATDLIRFQNGRLYVAGEVMGKAELGRWYQVMAVIEEASKKVSVYVDGDLKAAVYLTGYDLGQSYLRANVVRDNAVTAKTTLYLDDTAYTKGSYKVSFDPMPDETESGIEEEVPAETPEPGTAAPAVSLPAHSLLLCLDNTRAYADGVQVDLGAKPVSKNGALLLPLRAIAGQLGGTVSWNDETETASLVFQGRTAEFSDGSCPVVDGKTEGKEKAQLLGDVMYVPAAAAADLFGLELQTTATGGILFRDKGQTAAESAINAAVNALTYSRPSAEQILSDFKAGKPGNAHPRILIDSGRLEKIKGWVKSDPKFQAFYAQVKKAADDALKSEVCKYELRDGQRLLYVSRDVYTHIASPALVYLIEGDETYKERVWKELEAAAAFPDWHPTHFLDTAEMTLAFAIGYDWLYDAWTPKQRQTLQTAILKLGLDAAASAYDGTAEHGSEDGAYHNRLGWTKDYSNWGLVCNGGIAAGALAVLGDAEDAFCADIISKALRSIEYPLALLAPDGAWMEGLGYWEYAMRYMSYFFSSLTNANGTVYGCDMAPGMAGTAYFPVYHVGPKGSFNFGDAGETPVNAPVLFWFAEFLQNPGLNDVRLGFIEQYQTKAAVDDLLFYNPDLASGTERVDKERVFRNTETAVMANNWGSETANYIGLRGGTSGGNHGDLDTGVFVLDALGERWTVDYGTDDYNLPNYWFWPGRGDYYRKRAEGHSTLVINPDSGLDQKPGAVSLIQEMQSGESGAYAVLDMTPAYADKADSVQRAAALYDDRTKFMVQDEVHLPDKSDVWWLMQTKAGIEVAADGKSAVLTQNGKHLLLKLQSSDSKAVFTYTGAVPFETSPKGEGQAKNDGYRLAVHAKGVTSLNLRVTFIPYLDGQTPDETLLPLGPLEQLTSGTLLELEQPVYASASSILVDGQPMEHFDPQQFFYTLHREFEEKELPVITAESGFEVQVKNPDGDEVRITEMGEEGQWQVETLDGSALVDVIVSDPQGRLRDGVYHLALERKQTTYTPPETGKRADIAAVTASKTAEPENPPEHTIDGDVSTKWAAADAQWIQYDLGSEKTVTAVGTLWMTPTSRLQNYSIQFSLDGRTWETVFAGKSLGTQEGMEYYHDRQVKARYVRIAVDGTSAGNWSSLMETEIYTTDGMSA